MRRRLVALVALLAVGVAVWLLVAGVPGSADQHGAEVKSLTIKSHAVGQSLPVNVAVPEGGSEDRPLVIFMHGRGGDEGSELVSPMFAALAKEGDRAPVIAFPYGGESSYWHDRADGKWGAYVLREVIPQVEKEFGTDPKRVALGGISMGGYGAYELALLQPGRFCAVGGHSPAIFASAGETAAGAFDDAEDFDSHNPITQAQADQSQLGKTKFWMDSGDEDPFIPGDDQLASALKASGAKLQRSSAPGGHEASYWNSRWGDYLDFYANALAHC